MRISRFFIDRPIFASVISIVIVILGGVGFFRLPVAQYPEIAPPTITVTGPYPGASSDVVASTVVTPIEEQINGVENMIYMTSNSTSDGSFTISVTFDIGTNLDTAQVQVQNRVSVAEPRLPADVRAIGVTVNKSSPDIMMVVHLYSPDKSRDTLFMSNYANLEITDALARIDGVGSLIVFGARDYAMRVWLNPDRLQSVGLTARDVVTALQGQNVQVASGVLNQPPVAHPRAFQISVQTQGPAQGPEPSSAISSSSRPPTPWCACATSPPSSSPRRTTPPIPISIRTRRSPSAFSSAPAPTRCRPPPRSRRPWPICRSGSRPA